jgi:hypothetical protein
MKSRLLALLFASICFATTDADELGALVFQSEAQQTHLLELFTSEGCSSCPPAEAGLSKLKDDPRLWRDFVPVAFHVDYWDRLGWRDPFASAAWTARQYEYSARWKSSSVYTPGFVLDGREWRGSTAPPTGAASPGVLKISIADHEKVTATFRSESGSKPLELHVARLGFELSANVRAGENSGRKLLHDFVVLSLADAKMSGGKATVQLPAAPTSFAANSRSAMAAWVTDAGQLEAIQAVGGWLQ